MEYIDKIFIINLESRVDRWKQVTESCSSVGIPPEKIERFNAISTPENGCVGCALSHLAVCKLAYSRGYKTFCILEDDFEFTVSQEEFEQSIRYFFEKKVDWRVLMVTYNHKLTSPIPVDGDSVIALTNNAQNAAGYIVNGDSSKPYLGELIRYLEYGSYSLVQTGMHWIYANDQIWKYLQQDGKWYILLKRLGEQRESYSDLSKCICKND